MAVCRRGRGNSSSPSFRGVRQHPVESHDQGQRGTLSLPRRNQPGDSSPAAQALNDVRKLKCGAGWGSVVDAETQALRHSEGCASTPWNPTIRGNAVRCRYPGGTIWGIPAQSARMTADFQSRRRYPGGTNRGIPARSARMTADFQSRRRYLGRTNGGILRLLAQALNDRRFSEPSPLPCWNQQGDCVVAKSARLRFRLAAKASLAPLLLHLGPRAAAMRRLASKRACGRSFRTRSASPGSRPRRGQRSARMTADFQSRCRYLGGTNQGILRLLRRL